MNEIMMKWASYYEWMHHKWVFLRNNLKSQTCKALSNLYPAVTLNIHQKHLQQSMLVNQRGLPRSAKDIQSKKRGAPRRLHLADQGEVGHRHVNVMDTHLVKIWFESCIVLVSFLNSFQFHHDSPCPPWVQPIWSTLAPLPAAWWLSYWSTCWTCNICQTQSNEGEQRRRRTWAAEHCGRLHQAWEWPHTWGGVHRVSQQTAEEIPW